MRCLIFVLVVALLQLDVIDCKNVDDVTMMRWKLEQVQRHVDSYVGLVDFMTQDELPSWSNKIYNLNKNIISVIKLVEYVGYTTG